MGFRNHHDFNQALLAKQAWRQVTTPNSLCARVLRARYYKNGDFLEASCPKQASFTWRSIIFGRDLLKEGLIWRIGDGSDIRVMADRWIPRASLQRSYGLRPAKDVSKVSELLLESGGGWKVDKLSELFFEEDVADILKIPVGRAGTRDNLAWNYPKNEIFSVKSAYHLKQQIKRSIAGMVGSSSNIDEHQGWLALWSANVPGKVQVHCWRLAQNVPAVGTELERRSIKVGMRCVVCHRDETLRHKFWECPHAARI
jgi:hypothetical protein